MTENKEVSWDEAIAGGLFIKLETEEMKVISITGWKLVEVEKEFNGKSEMKVEFQAKCVEEDGQPVEKEFNTSSNRLKTKLRAILEKKEPKETVKLSILKVGEKFNTQYSVKEL